MELSFTDYTATAQTSLVSAAQEAAAMHSMHIEPEHLLLALLTPEAGTAWSVLSGKLRNPVLLREGAKIALVDVARGDNVTPPDYSFRTNRALREAQDEARRAGHAQVDTSHLLLGLLDEGGAAGQMLRRQGLDAQWLRHWLRQPRPAAAPPPASAPAPVKQDVYAGKPLRQVLPRLVSWPAVTIMFALLLAGGWLTTRSDATQTRAGLFVIVLTGWIISLCLHEFAHAFIADLGGDHSVRVNGYLSFNPIKYTHPLLSIVLPIIFVLLGGIGLPGGAVYIDRTRVHGPKWESAISLAGPTASLLITVIYAVPFLLRLDTPENVNAAPLLWQALAVLVMLNSAAVMLNLLPIPPLDGFGVMAPWLAPSVRAALYGLSSMGIFVVFLLLSTNANINGIFWNTVYNIMRALRVPPDLAESGLQAFMFWRPG